MIKKIGLLVLLVFFTVQVAALAQEEINHPFAVNPLPAPSLKVKKQSLYADFFDNHIFDRIEQYFMISRGVKRLCGVKTQAQMVNAYDEVPDSPFFTNRHARKRLTTQELVTGANVNAGPDMSRPWVVTKGKSSGISAGFSIVDGRGDRYLIKLDHIDYPEMSSSSEIIASKIMHAIGYNVPQYTIVRFKKDMITVDPSARHYDETGFERPLTLDKVYTILEKRGYANEEGIYRASASKILEGKPVGYVSFRTHRKEDRLDQIPHEHRREIRALRVFSSWIHNNDIRRSNSLDMLLETKDGWYLKHYIIDFGSSFGSHTFRYKYPEAGFTYLVDVPEIGKSLVTGGLYSRPYYKPTKPVSQAIGHFTNDNFHPGKWRPMIPTFAFDNMTKRDAFWATKIIMAFSDEDIKTLVTCGELTNEADREYLIKTVIDRRDMIGEYWFHEINPLDSFAIGINDDVVSVSFENLAEKYGFLKEGEAENYECTVYKLNEKGKSKKPLTHYTSTNSLFEIPRTIFTAGTQYALDIRPQGSVPSWQHPVRLIVNDTLSLVGIERAE